MTRIFVVTLFLIGWNSAKKNERNFEAAFDVYNEFSVLTKEEWNAIPQSGVPRSLLPDPLRL